MFGRIPVALRVEQEHLADLALIERSVNGSPAQRKLEIVAHNERNAAYREHNARATAAAVRAVRLCAI